MSKLNKLLKAEGMSVEDLVRQGVMNSVCPGICMNESCDYTTNVEPDCTCGYCEVCDTRSVKSGLVLLSII